MPSQRLRLPATFSDHGLLQADMPITLWGWGPPHAELCVRFAGSECRHQIGEGGSWQLSFPSQQAGTAGTLERWNSALATNT
ncbi:MAG: hypothetical protein PF961_22175 [Planctomycetota bacterium]|jgi:sialate O-acetylesterase|nr:hypothetical protein [Planctomycetota bacterium]